MPSSKADQLTFNWGWIDIECVYDGERIVKIMPLQQAVKLLIDI